LLNSHLTMPTTGITAAGTRSVSRAAPATAVAALMAWQLYFCLHPEGCFLKGDRQVVAQIITTPPPAAAAVASTEDVTEDIAKHILERCAAKIEPPRRETAPAQSGVTELIVGCALLCLGQNSISLGEFLELLLRTFIPLIFIRMILDRQPTISLLDLALARIFIDFKYLVVIAFIQGVPSWQPVSRQQHSRIRKKSRVLLPFLDFLKRVTSRLFPLFVVLLFDIFKLGIHD
jgi:hypothetical protein